MKRFLLACLLMLGAAPAFAQTSLTFSSTPGDYIGMGDTVTWTTSNSDLQINGSRSAIQAMVSGYNSTKWMLDISAPIGEELMPGTYVGAERTAFATGRAPGLDFSGGGRGCGQIFGSFTIRQIKFDTLGRLSRLEATAIQHCEGESAPPLALEIRYRSSPYMFGVESAASHWVGQGIKQSYYNDTSTFRLDNATPGEFTYRASGMRREWDVLLALPPNKTRFEKGIIYTRAVAEGVYGKLWVGSNAHGCGDSGLVNVLEVIYGPNDRIDKFYADFNHYCTPDRTGPVLKGRIRYVRGI